MANYIQILGDCFPDAQAIVRTGKDPNVYEDLEWSTTPISKATLDASECAQNEVSNQVETVGVKGEPGTGETLIWNGDNWVSVALVDEKVKVSSNDTTANHLINKLVAGTNITITENNNGGNETLTIAAIPGGQGSPNECLPEFFDAYSTSTATISGGWTDVTLEVEREKTAAFTHTANSADITINEKDTYVIIFRVSAIPSSGTSASASSARIMLDTGSGYNEVVGSYVYLFNQRTASGISTGTGQLTLELEAGHRIKIQACRYNGTNTIGLVSGGSGITIFSVTNRGHPGVDGVNGVDGIDGEPGPPGSGSNIVIQNNGVNVTDTPHSILNFIGASITNQGGSPNSTVNIECSSVGGPKEFFADQVEYCSGSNWQVTSGAPACVDSLNNALTVRRFDDTTNEAIGFMLTIPAGATNVKFENIIRAQTAPDSSRTICHSIAFRHISHNSNPSSWSTYNLSNATIPTNTAWQIVTTSTLSLGTVGLTAGKTYQFQYYRNASNVSDDLVGDMAWLRIGVEFS